ncbi:MAG: DUF72 domain-containing protein [Sphingobacteriales bacterium]|nr:DUF72 domain-containing protein [Sphingobacteriales bacterium]
MEFGRVNPEEIHLIDFKLPEDTEFTKNVLSAANKKEFEAYVGCARWGRKEWVGQIYPKGTKDANFLDEYVKHFNCIEMNATFYKIYDAKSIKKWKDKATKNTTEFKFCPKISQTISHIRRLKNTEAETTAFFEGIMAFEEFLGPIFLQLSDNFGPKNFEIIKAYLEQLPVDFPIYVEVRHKDWFTPDNATQLFKLLNSLNIGSIITDATGRRDCTHMNLATPHAFIRFVGNGLHPTDYQRIDDWVERLKNWKAQGLQSFYFFMHQHKEEFSPKLCDYAIQKLNEHLGLNIKRPKFISQTTLF